MVKQSSQKVAFLSFDYRALKMINQPFQGEQIQPHCVVEDIVADTFSVNKESDVLIHRLDGGWE